MPLMTVFRMDKNWKYLKLLPVVVTQIYEYAYNLYVISRKIT